MTAIRALRAVPAGPPIVSLAAASIAFLGALAVVQSLPDASLARSLFAAALLVPWLGLGNVMAFLPSISSSDWPLRVARIGGIVSTFACAVLLGYGHLPGWVLGLSYLVWYASFVTCLVAAATSGTAAPRGQVAATDLIPIGLLVCGWFGVLLINNPAGLGSQPLSWGIPFLVLAATIQPLSPLAYEFRGLALFLRASGTVSVAAIAGFIPLVGWMTSLGMEVSLDDLGIDGVVSIALLLLFIVIQFGSVFSLLRLAGLHTFREMVAAGRFASSTSAAGSWLDTMLEAVVDALARLVRTAFVIAAAPRTFGRRIGSGSARVVRSVSHPLTFLAITVFFESRLRSDFRWSRPLNSPAGQNVWELLGADVKFDKATLEIFATQTVPAILLIYVVAALLGTALGSRRSAIQRAFLYSVPPVLTAIVLVFVAQNLIPVWSAPFKGFEEIWPVAGRMGVALLVWAFALLLIIAGPMLAIGVGDSALDDVGGTTSVSFTRRMFQFRMLPVLVLCLTIVALDKVAPWFIARKSASCTLIDQPEVARVSPDRVVNANVLCRSNGNAIGFSRDQCMYAIVRQKDFWSGPETVYWAPLKDAPEPLLISDDTLIPIRFTERDLAGTKLGRQIGSEILDMLAAERLTEAQSAAPGIRMRIYCGSHAWRFTDSLSLMPKYNSRVDIRRPSATAPPST